MSKKSTIKPLSVAIGAAFVSSVALTGVAQADNPFAVTDLSSGYMVAGGHGGDKDKDHEGKCGEGKCGEGKCGGDKHAKDKSHEEGKCGEGKCGEGKCGGDKKAKDKSHKEGKCGEGKCGGAA